MENQGVDVKQSNKALIITGLVIALFVVGLITNGFGLFSPNVTGGAIDNPSESLEVGNSPVLGQANAPVTIYVFSDFSCPYCGAAAGQNLAVISQFKTSNPGYEPAVPAIIEEYVNTGKAKLVFKYYPGHGQGQAAHLVGWALNDQGKFWEFHDLAFANQEDTDNLDKMKELAEQVGADMTKLNADIDSGKYQSYFTLDTAMGQAIGVSGTPLFVINDEVVSGAQSFQVFKDVIDSELSN